MEIKDEIEINGIKYVRKQEQNMQNIFSAKSYSDVCDYYIYRCGAPNCDNFASEDIVVRNTVLISGQGEDGEYDIIYFTCPNGHRNGIRI